MEGSALSQPVSSTSGPMPDSQHALQMLRGSPPEPLFAPCTKLTIGALVGERTELPLLHHAQMSAIASLKILWRV